MLKERNKNDRKRVFNFIQRKKESKKHKRSKRKIRFFLESSFWCFRRRKKVIIKDWGIFEKKEVKPRKILNLATREMMITEEKKVIKFKPRMKMIDKVNELNTLMEEEYEH